MTRPIKILWAVDAFEERIEVFENSTRLLKSLGPLGEIEITPTYVLGPKQLNLTIEMSPPLKDTYVPAAHKALAHRLRSCSVPHLKAEEVLVTPHASLREAAHLLVAHAKLGAFDLIVTGTHGRAGLSRLLLGSFAEELILQSPIPVLTIGSQEAKLPRGERIESVLFPTDLREESLPVFRRCSQLARSLGAKLTLLHAVPPPLVPAFQSGVYLLSGTWMPYYEFSADKKALEQNARTLAKAWMAQSELTPEQLEVIVDTSSPSVTASILTHASQAGSPLIAMAAQSSRLASATMGSIVRQIVRGAPCPVWISRNSS